MPLITTENAQIKETISENSSEIISVNISYPVFDAENKNKIAEKLNSFFSCAAMGFHDFCKKKYAPFIIRTRNGRKIEKSGAVMNYYISYHTEHLLSVITDISFYDGQNKNTARRVHNFRLSDCTTLRAKNAFSTSRTFKKHCCDIIASKIEAGLGGFDYFANASAVACEKFDFEKFYFTPKGVAFYYDKGTLYNNKNNFPVFVIPPSEINGLTPLFEG